LAFSQTGTRSPPATAKNRSTYVRLHRPGIRLGQPYRHNEAVTSVAFSPEGTRIATGSDDKNCFDLWEANDPGQPRSDTTASTTSRSDTPGVQPPYGNPRILPLACQDKTVPV